MDIRVPFAMKLNAPTLLRRAGYAVFDDPNTGITSFTKRLSSGGDFYPRFHVYLKDGEGYTIISLHLDQKKPSYAGSRAHNAEYDGPTVEAEAQRIIGFIQNQLHNQEQ